MELRNRFSITQTAAAVAALLGCQMPDKAALGNPAVLEKGSVFGGMPVRKVLLYNPDA